MDGIVIRGVSKTYGDSTALDGLDLDVQPGELVVLVGPSGSGKTTLLRLVAGLDRPMAGTIRLAGRDLAGVPPRRRDVALVFQSLALYGHLTVQQNLAFGLNAQTAGGWLRSLVWRGPATADVREQVAEAARLLGIERLLDRRPAELSGGEQQRVALGRAIVRRPRALLLDEPLSSLDLPTRRTLRRELAALQRRLEVPTIYVTHDQAEAMLLGDRIAVLDRGRLAQVGTPDDIYHRPQTRLVAEFFGLQGMNLIEGELIGEGFEIRHPDGTDSSRLPLSRDRWPEGRIEGPVLLGIRPEHIELAKRSDASEGLTGVVTAVESLGEGTYLSLRLANTNTMIVARNCEPAGPPALGTMMALRLRPDRIHWFSTTGARL